MFESATEVMTSVHFSYAQTTSQQFDQLFDGLRAFDYPKNHNDLCKIITYLSDEDSLILDFFAGSAAQAMQFMNPI